MSDVIPSGSVDSIGKYGGTPTAAASEESVLELVSLHRSTPRLSSDPTNLDVTTTALGLMPTKPVLLLGPVASTDKSVRSMARQTGRSINRLTGKQTPTHAGKGKAKAVSKAPAKASAATPASPLVLTNSTSPYVPVSTITVPSQTRTQKDMFVMLTHNNVSLNKKLEETNVRITFLEELLTTCNSELLALIRDSNSTWDTQLIEVMEDRLHLSVMVNKVFTALNETRTGFNDLSLEVV